MSVIVRTCQIHLHCKDFILTSLFQKYIHAGNFSRCVFDVHMKPHIYLYYSGQGLRFLNIVGQSILPQRCGTVHFKSTFWDNEVYVNIMRQNSL